MNEIKEQQNEKKGWYKAQPEKLPPPTYWPFYLAMGLAFIFWGIISSWIIISVGFIIFIIALAGWISNMRYEAREESALKKEQKSDTDE